MDALGREELRRLIERVFAPRADDTRIAVLVDLPDAAVPDHELWRTRRELAAGWARELAAAAPALGHPTDLVLYRNVRANNADLPARAWLHHGGPLPVSADALDEGASIAMAEVLAGHSIIIAPTQFSTTAPLKLTAKGHGFRAATMPGFSSAMVPALRLDYGEINRRVLVLKALLDEAERCELALVANGVEHGFVLDLRHRSGHASGGVLTERGVAGNLPSGEAYIVPYEGERAGDPSQTGGVLPVELDGELVFYEVTENRARRARPGGAVATRETAKLASEPAYGNIAELGLGVLGELGVKPVGDVLLDEKLGLHVAFGRSDHFGGQVGAAQFSKPEAVVHIDRVYVPELQPRVRVARVDLVFERGARRLPLLRDGAWVLDFGRPAGG
jgi:hypothetical protein